MENKNDILQKTPIVGLLAILCCILWGSAFPCIKIGYALLGIKSGDCAAQILFAGVRFAIAGIMVIIISSFIRKRFIYPKRKSIGNVVKLSMVQTVLQYLLFYIGLAHASGVKSSIVEASNVFIAILFSAFVFRYEKLTVGKIIGCIVGFIGVVVINIPSGGMDMSMSLAGEGAVFLSTVAYAFSSGLIKYYSETEDTLVLSGYQFLIGGLIMAVAGVIFGGRLGGFTPQAVWLLIYMAFISAAAYSVWGILLSHNEVGRVAVYGFTNPMFGVILSAIFLKEGSEAFGVKGIAALVLVCIGIYLVNKKGKNAV